MAFSSDSDLQTMLPAIFSYGISSFAAYHQPASDELGRDVRRLWIPRQSTVKAADFEPDNLDSDQWKRAACCRVLAWHVLPILMLESPKTSNKTETLNATKTDTETDSITTTATGSTPDFGKLIDIYKTSYLEEINSVIDDGVYYDSGSGLARIQSYNKAESQRLTR
jgi:hypothetical protein